MTATLVAGAIGAFRQRSEMRRVREGRLPALGPAGEDPDGPDGALHHALASWRPVRPATRAGRGLVAVWCAPLTAVGLVAAVLAGGRPRWEPAHGCLVAESGEGRVGAVMRSHGAAAATLGQLVLSRGAAPGDALLAHETAHVRQQERLGPLFALAYPWAQASWGYRGNPFEVAARAVAADEVSRTDA